jgi:hypothetical protein
MKFRDFQGSLREEMFREAIRVFLGNRLGTFQEFFI